MPAFAACRNRDTGATLPAPTVRERRGDVRRQPGVAPYQLLVGLLGGPAEKPCRRASRNGVTRLAVNARRVGLCERSFGPGVERLAVDLMLRRDGLATTIPPSSSRSVGGAEHPAISAGVRMCIDLIPARARVERRKLVGREPSTGTPWVSSTSSVSARSSTDFAPAQPRRPVCARAPAGPRRRRSSAGPAVHAADAARREDTDAGEGGDEHRTRDRRRTVRCARQAPPGRVAMPSRSDRDRLSQGTRSARQTGRRPAALQGPRSSQAPRLPHARCARSRVRTRGSPEKGSRG